MRVLILSPTAFPRVSGNAVTAERWRRHLHIMGVDARVLGTEGMGPGELDRVLEGLEPDLIHVHHVFRAGRALWQGNGGLSQGIPLVVSPGGTDLNLDVNSSQRRRLMELLAARARFLVVQSQEMEARLLECFYQLGPKVVRVPKACAWFGDEAFDIRGKAGVGPEDFLFFLPAGVRPVKGNLEWLRAMEELHRLRPHVRVVLAGPILDPSYGQRFLEEVRRLHGFARWIGTIPPWAMRGAYEGADVVVNASFSEGLSNVLLEAACQGKPLLASDIPGNRWPVLGSGQEDPCGLLYDPQDPKDLVSKALLLVDDPGLGLRLSAAGRARSFQLASPLEEAASLASIYERAVTG
jgi:glycosyltransferase involved in cell wall biosynthesis